MTDVAIVLDVEAHAVVEPIPIEVAWVQVHLDRLGPDVPIEPVVRRFDPGRPITLGALAVHHIRDEDVRDCPRWEPRHAPKCDYLIGHHVDFDWQAIGEPRCRRICTLALARRVWPELDTHVLTALGYHVGLGRDLLQNTHGAVVDVIVTARVLGELVAELRPANWQALWEMSEDARVPTHFHFGKHKGKAIRDVPTDYLQWLAKQDGFEHYTIVAVRRELDRRWGDKT